MTGFAFTASYLGIPAISLAPIPLRLKQWQILYDLGALVSPTLSVASASIWAYLAYTSYSSGTNVGKQQGAVISKSSLYSLAAVATGSVIVYTGLFIVSTNKDLMRLNKTAGMSGAGSVSEAEVKALITSWSSMTYVRAVLPMLGSLVGLYAVIS